MLVRLDEMEFHLIKPERLSKALNFIKIGSQCFVCWITNSNSILLFILWTNLILSKPLNPCEPVSDIKSVHGLYLLCKLNKNKTWFKHVCCKTWRMHKDHSARHQTEIIFILLKFKSKFKSLKEINKKNQSWMSPKSKRRKKLNEITSATGFRGVASHYHVHHAVPMPFNFSTSKRLHFTITTSAPIPWFILYFNFYFIKKIWVYKISWFFLFGF